MDARTADALSRHVVVCGLGHVGFRVASLLSRLGVPFAVIAGATRDEWRTAVSGLAPLLSGDARDERLLRAAGIERARVVLAVTDDDRANVSIALDARRVNPSIAVVVRLFDQQLAPLLEASLGDARALSASALAAPAFVAAALGAGALGAFEFAGRSGLIEEIAIAQSESGSTRTVGSLLAEVGHGDVVTAIARHRDGQVTLAPASDAPVATGDRVTLARVAGRERACGHGPHSRILDAALAFLGGLREWWRETPFVLRALLGTLTAIVLASVVFFHIALGLTPIDALYFVVTTVTTTGYGDFNLMAASWYVKVYGMLVMLSGAALFAVLVSIATDLVVRTRLADVLARGRPRRHGHIVVVGIGTVGYRVVRELKRRGETVVAIEHKEASEFVGPARSLATVVVGNARAEETQRRAGLSGAKAVVAVTDDDLTNLGIGLAAKQARSDCRVVLRIFDGLLAEKMQGRLDVAAVLSGSAVVAPTFVGAALCPETLSGFVLGNHLVVLCQRKAGAVAAASCGTAGEHVLLVTRSGEAGPRTLEPGEPPQAGDDVLGVRWFPLSSAPTA
jgi:Trk K+ transport system NAD-binding subunit